MFVDVVVGISVEEKQSAIDAVDQAPFDVRCYMSVGCSCVSVMAYSEYVTFKVVSCVCSAWFSPGPGALTIAERSPDVAA